MILELKYTTKNKIHIYYYLKGTENAQQTDMHQSIYTQREPRQPVPAGMGGSISKKHI